MKKIVRFIGLAIVLVFGSNLAGAQMLTSSINSAEIVHKTLVKNSHELINYIESQRKRLEYLSHSEAKNSAEEAVYMQKLLLQMLTILEYDHERIGKDPNDWRIERLYTIAELAQTLLVCLDIKLLGMPYKVLSNDWRSEAKTSVKKKRRSIWRNLAYFTVIFNEVIESGSFAGSYERLCSCIDRELLDQILKTDLRYLEPIIKRGISWISSSETWDGTPIRDDTLPYLYVLAEDWRERSCASEVVGLIEDFVFQATGIVSSDSEKVIKFLEEVYYQPASGSAISAGERKASYLRLCKKLLQHLEESKITHQQFEEARTIIAISHQELDQILEALAQVDKLLDLKAAIASETVSDEVLASLGKAIIILGGEKTHQQLAEIFKLDDDRVVNLKRIILAIEATYQGPHLFVLLRLIMKISESFTEKNLNLIRLDREMAERYRNAIDAISKRPHAIRGEKYKQLKEFCRAEVTRPKLDRAVLKNTFLRLFNEVKNDLSPEERRSLGDDLINNVQIIDDLTQMRRSIVNVRDFWAHPELECDLKKGYVGLYENLRDFLDKHREQIIQSYRFAKRVSAAPRLTSEELCDRYLPLFHFRDGTKKLGLLLEKVCKTPANIYHNLNQDQRKRAQDFGFDLADLLQASFIVRNLESKIDRLHLTKEAVRNLRKRAQEFDEFSKGLNFDNGELAEEYVEFSELLKEIIYIPDIFCKGYDWPSLQANALFWARAIEQGEVIPLQLEKQLLDALHLYRPKVNDLLARAALLDEGIIRLLAGDRLKDQLKEIGDKLWEICNGSDEWVFFYDGERSDSQYEKFILDARAKGKKLAEKLQADDRSISLKRLESDLIRNVHLCNRNSAVQELLKLVRQMCKALEEQREKLDKFSEALNGFGQDLESIVTENLSFERAISTAEIDRRRKVGEELAKRLQASDCLLTELANKLRMDVCLFDDVNRPDVHRCIQDASALDKSLFTECFPWEKFEGSVDGDDLTLKKELETEFHADSLDVAAVYDFYLEIVRETYQHLLEKLVCLSGLSIRSIDPKNVSKMLERYLKAGRGIREIVGMQEIAILEYLLSCLNELAFKNRYIWQESYPERVSTALEWRRDRNYVSHGVDTAGALDYDAHPELWLLSLCKYADSVINADTGRPQLEGAVPTVLWEQNVFGNIYEVFNVAGDGNCFFRAVADQLNRVLGKRITHIELRMRAIQQIRDHLDHYSNFVENGDLKSYLERLEQDGEWVDGLIIQALIDALKINLVIITDQRREIPVLPGTGKSRATIYLGHYTDLHYVSLVPRREDFSVTMPARKPKSSKLFGTTAALPEKHRLFLTELYRDLARRGVPEQFQNALVITEHEISERASRRAELSTGHLAAVLAEQLGAREPLQDQKEAESKVVVTKPAPTKKQAATSRAASPVRLIAPSPKLQKSKSKGVQSALPGTTKVSKEPKVSTDKKEETPISKAVKQAATSTASESSKESKVIVAEPVIVLAAPAVNVTSAKLPPKQELSPDEKSRLWNQARLRAQEGAGLIAQAVEKIRTLGGTRPSKKEQSELYRLSERAAAAFRESAEINERIKNLEYEVTAHFRLCSALLSQARNSANDAVADKLFKEARKEFEKANKKFKGLTTPGENCLKAQKEAQNQLEKLGMYDATPSLQHNVTKLSKPKQRKVKDADGWVTSFSK